MNPYPIDLTYLAPELALFIFSIITLAFGVLTTHKKIVPLLAVTGVVLSGLLLPLSLGVSNTSFPMLVNDGFSAFARSLSVIIALFVVLLSMGYKPIDDDEIGEYYFFVLTITVSLMVACASNNLMMIYITLETISLLSYIFAGFFKRDIFSSESGLKYFLFGALSTGITLYGISLVFGLFGTLDLGTITQSLAQGVGSREALTLALLLVLVGFGFKCSLVPFHMWTPDVYQGAPTPVAALFSVGPKAIGFIFLLRVFVISFGDTIRGPWIFVAGLISILTMTLGNIIALQQTNIKRLLAYSTIAQAGYILIGLVIQSAVGIKATMFYLFVYSIMNLAAFGVVIAVSSAIKGENIEDYSGLYKRSPFLAFVLAVAFLSLAGIPPLAGFMAKFFIFAAAIESHFTVLVIFAALNSVVSLYYYANIIRFAFLSEPKDATPISATPSIQAALAVMMTIIMMIGVYPYPILQWLDKLLS